MNSNKQSSVEWVIENLTLMHALLSRREIGVEFFKRKYNEIVERGKAMHKEEIEDAWDKGDYCIDLPDGTWEQKYKSAEQYYNEKFEGGNK